jgi:serine/threonine protein kinase
MHHLHRHGLVHRDLKTLNLLVDENARGQYLIRICDFGSSRSVDLQEYYKEYTAQQSLLSSFISQSQTFISTKDISIGNNNNTKSSEQISTGPALSSSVSANNTPTMPLPLPSSYNSNNGSSNEFLIPQNSATAPSTKPLRSCSPQQKQLLISPNNRNVHYNSTGGAGAGQNNNNSNNNNNHNYNHNNNLMFPSAPTIHEHEHEQPLNQMSGSSVTKHGKSQSGSFVSGLRSLRHLFSYNKNITTSEDQTISLREEHLHDQYLFEDNISESGTYHFNRERNLSITSQLMHNVASPMSTIVGSVQFLAPEILRNIEFKVNSRSAKAKQNSVYGFSADVYSYGCVIWEIVTRREIYKGKSYSEIQKFVLSNNRPIVLSSELQGCPDGNFLIRLMNQCWQTEAVTRPNFGQIIQMLEDRKEKFIPPSMLETNYSVTEEGRSRSPSLRNNSKKNPAAYVGVPPQKKRHGSRSESGSGSKQSSKQSSKQHRHSRHHPRNHNRNQKQNDNQNQNHNQQQKQQKQHNNNTDYRARDRDRERERERGGHGHGHGRQQRRQHKHQSRPRPSSKERLHRQQQQQQQQVRHARSRPRPTPKTQQSSASHGHHVRQISSSSSASGIRQQPIVVAQNNQNQDQNQNQNLNKYPTPPPKARSHEGQQT